jgi:hypothetical protein
LRCGSSARAGVGTSSTTGSNASSNACHVGVGNR